MVNSIIKLWCPKKKGGKLYNIITLDLVIDNIL